MTDENIEAQTGTTEAKPAGMPDWLLPDRVYDVLKWVALIVLPAMATLVQALGPVWGWTWADPAATTINAVALTIGVVIGASALKAKASKAE
ncbi:phage holin [Bifidobacterium breve]|uniref:phage holin n=1 Tax=Bifidobacterium breve TaxID=1685 RepID=UPI0032DF2F0E